MAVGSLGSCSGRPLDEMSEDDLLACAGACAEAIRGAEADLLRSPTSGRSPTTRPARPGRGRTAGPRAGPPLRREGTPQVCEFAAAELGARIGRSPYAAAQLMADALDLHHRHPAVGPGPGR